MKKIVITDLTDNSIMTSLYAGCLEKTTPGDYFQIHEDYWNGSPICGGSKNILIFVS